MENAQSIISPVLKVVALAMAVATVVLGILGSIPVDSGITLLGIGLFALSPMLADRIIGTFTFRCPGDTDDVYQWHLL